jgi:hypothetical protein
MKVIKPPMSLETSDKKTIFLAGSIEMGNAENWQQVLEDKLSDEDVVLFNPRRDDWDSSWKQSIENGNFREQVEWELAALEIADLIVMYFDKNTKSAISLLELGLFARSGKLIVCCPKEFWRSGNVDVTCVYYGVKQVDNLNGLYVEILNILK